MSTPEGINELAGFIGALRRDDIPTLSEAQAAMPMVTSPDGAVMPARLADRGERGWDGPDGGNRDSGAATELARLVKLMDQMTDDVIHQRQAYSAIRLANTWAAIRKITRENGGK